MEELTRLTRRSVLGSVAGFPLLGTEPAARAAFWRESAVNILSHRGSARWIGIRCLAVVPDAATLVQRTLERLVRVTADASVAVHSCIVDDYAQSRVVYLDGWTISETEAALCVLCAARDGGA